MSDNVSMPDSRLFSHDAMNTTFRLRLCEEDETLARDMARECFDLLDLLESRLSRFIESSDVSRINKMQAGETLYISEECHQCLLIALNGHARTGGLFDITLGRRIEHRKGGHAGPPPPLEGRLTIHPEKSAITCEIPGREIDLGGIGKGFALDQIHQHLIGWEAKGGLLAAGASSLLAFGPEPWPVDLAGSTGSVRHILRNQALSASGTGIQGSHIIHPSGDEAMPADACNRVWVTAGTAAVAEIWSTSLMLIDAARFNELIAGDKTISSIHIDRNGKIETLLHTSCSAS
jgi:FAD:protein FMN transferase